MARDSSDIASEVAATLHKRTERDNPTEHVDYNIHKNRNNLYSMTSLPYNQRDIDKQQNDILGPLSLFAPYVHEEAFEEELVPERPMTPIDEEIRGPCKTFKQLSTYVLRRITADSSRPYLEVEDQEGLAGVLLGELNGIWTDLYKQADDPFLSKEQNFEMKRLMTVRIVDICKTLFNQYIEKAQILNKRGVFTGPANVSRLKSQLGIEGHRNLNVPSIRRWAAEAMLGDLPSSGDEGKSEMKSEQPKSSRRSSTRKPPVPTVRTSPRRRSPKRKPFTLENELRDMNTEMPTLKTEKLMSVLEEMDQLRDRPVSKPVSRAETRTADKPKTGSRYRPKRSRSVEEKDRADGTLAHELEIDVLFELKRSDSTHLINIPCLMKIAVVEAKPTTAQLVKNDLENLMARNTEDEKKAKGDDDMPPLIQAITRSAKHDDKRAKIDKQLEELNKREQEYLERKKVRPHEKPTYPQPDTVASKLPNKMPVRTSDVRVSERVCMSSFTIDMFGPLYNDLMGEVDKATVKAMDKNLFMGDEIKEVYQEIMKSMPDDHLTLSNDELVQPTADSVNLSSILMPSGLRNRVDDKIVNNGLQKSRQPPWKKQNVMQWAKTPVTQLKDVKAENFGSPRKHDSEDITNIPGMILTMEEYREQLADCPRQVQERLSRNYLSWLTWWKSTTSSEDYQKFLASQETDYLGYMFHYYDSDDEVDGDSKSTSKKTKRSYQSASHHSLGTVTLAEQAQMEELKAEKNAYTPGFWNPCTVLMGGLGKDPVIENDDRCLTPASDMTGTSYVSLGKKLRLKSDNISSHSVKSFDTELSRTIVSKHNESVAEAQRIAEANKPKGPTPQDRLEKVWTLLQMPDHMKLDMAIKYSSDQYMNLLGGAIEAWENATDCILDRERMLSRLENFERLASDPNRFFERGFRGSSVARLEEAKQRSYYYKRLDDMEVTTKDTLAKIESEFQDKVSFQGRPYIEKMQWDRIEMLFWLQEERKQNVLERHSIAKGVPLGLGRHEPTFQTVSTN